MTAASFVSRLLTLGGDRRIQVREGHNTNQYGSSPFPRATLSYASSTANDISLPAFEHLSHLLSRWPQNAMSDPAFYADSLEGLRHRFREAFGCGASTEVVFAPSGTDLEYVALALAGPCVTNILIGADEVGSGCVLSAAGRWFAKETAVTSPVPKGDPLAGMERTDLHEIPVRDAFGAGRSSAQIASDIEALASDAERNGTTCLVHVVYGSKPGLVLPGLADLDILRARFPAMKVVVDACQARIGRAEIAELLGRDCMVLLTGSKFMGGPPFSGIGLVPQSWSPRRRLPEALAKVFRRGEWPGAWTGCENLPDSANPGLLLRLEAALFELERFRAICGDDLDRVIGRFGFHIRSLANAIGAGLVEPCLNPGALHTATLATLDLTPLPARPDFTMAQRWHKVLAARGMRLGQPVKCIPMGNGKWGGTLRLSLSMPLIGELAALSPHDLDARLSHDMRSIANVIIAAQRGVA